jgi:flagellar biogenesis protein FliO
MEWLNQMASVGLVFLLLGVALWLLGRGRRTAPGRGRRRAEVEIERRARLVLTPQHTLHVVEFEGRRMLIGTHVGGLMVLEAEAAGTMKRAAEEAPAVFAFDRDWL